MRALAVLALAMLAAATLAPAAVADHPGSNLGLKRFATLADPLGLDATVHRLPDVERTFAEWNAEYPDLVERFNIGLTSSGQPLLGIRITDESVADDAAPLSTGGKLRVYLDGGHHGNEFLGVELVMYYLEDVLTKASEGDEATLAFLRETEIHAVPIINVDGNFLDTRKNIRQVDPNRNYDYQWGGPGSGGSITDLNYRGPAPHSEAEVLANAEFGQTLSPDLWITMHTGVAEFYWPWGWTMDPSPDDAFFSSLEGPFENATNGRVDAMQAAELYEAAGATDDYGYGVVGTAAFTFEVHEDQFIPVYGETIPALIQEQLAGLDFMVKNVKRLGAWVEARPAMGGGWELTNEGWGAAPRVNVTSGGVTTTLPQLEPGETVHVAAGNDLVVDYPILFIESSRVRTHDYSDAVFAQDAPPQVDVPAPGLALLAVALVGAALIARRRS
jgi:hypothetical protein